MPESTPKSEPPGFQKARLAAFQSKTLGFWAPIFRGPEARALLAEILSTEPQRLPAGVWHTDLVLKAAALVRGTHPGPTPTQFAVRNALDAILEHDVRDPVHTIVAARSIKGVPRSEHFQETLLLLSTPPFELTRLHIAQDDLERHELFVGYVNQAGNILIDRQSARPSVDGSESEDPSHPPRKSRPRVNKFVQSPGAEFEGLVTGRPGSGSAQPADQSLVLDVEYLLDTYCSRRERLLYRLRYGRGRTAAQIGRHLRMTENTVDKALSRLREKLRPHLADYA